MLFTHDTDAALRFAARLVNSGGRRDDVEELADLDDLDRLLSPDVWTGTMRRDRRELEEVRALRERLRQVWHADERQVVDLVNAILAESEARPQLVDHDDYGWHIHAAKADSPLATRMAVDVAMALVDVIRAGELSRLKGCAAADCDDVVVDLSRNRSKRFCDGGCGNRENVRAYRRRRTAGAGG